MTAMTNNSSARQFAPFLAFMMIFTAATFQISGGVSLAQEILPAAGPESSNVVHAAVRHDENLTRKDDARPAIAGRSGEPFNQTSYIAPEGLLWQKWRSIEKAIETELGVVSRCQGAPQECPTGAASKFSNIVTEALRYDRRTMLGIVNRAVNLSIAYTADSKQFGVDDYWATPFESFAAGKGDCEDYAIAKLAVLRAANWPVDDLRIVVLRDSFLREFHAVVAVRENGSWWILDNRTMAVIEDVKLAHYHPLFVVDASTVRQMSRPAPRDGFTLTGALSTNSAARLRAPAQF
jgi:predicted transglutaminase-like cysteine proteinase